MIRVLVTGSTGFVGCRLLKTLEKSEFEILVLSRLPHPDHETIVCDLGKEPVPESALEKVTTVFHLAGYAHDLHDPSQAEHLYQTVNVCATVQLAELAAQQGVKHFVFVSSVKAGGSAKFGCCMTEEDQGSPEGVYGRTKREAELRILEVGRQSDMSVSIVRSSLVYGPGVKGNLSLLLKFIEKGIPLPLGSITSNKRSFVSITNLIDLIEVCLVHPKAANEIFLVSDNEDISTVELIIFLAKAKFLY